MAAGVGRTALLVAAARAIETAGWPVHPDQVPDGIADALWGRLGRYFGLRTRVLDDHLLGSVRAGVRQVVLLGAGLDSRVFRLDWPPGCTVHEVDTGEALTFKQAVRDRIGAMPVAERRPLAVDLRDDWAQALLDSGFSPGVPTAWLAEGLLLYLPAEAERRLVATVDRLSAAGSTLVYEIGVDLLALFDTRPRPDSADELARRGWAVETRSPYDFTVLHGRGPLPQPNDALAVNRWVFATAVGSRLAPGRAG